MFFLQDSREGLILIDTDFKGGGTGVLDCRGAVLFGEVPAQQIPKVVGYEVRPG